MFKEHIKTITMTFRMTRLNKFKQNNPASPITFCGYWMTLRKEASQFYMQFYHTWHHKAFEAQKTTAKGINKSNKQILSHLSHHLEIKISHMSISLVCSNRYCQLNLFGKTPHQAAHNFKWPMKAFIISMAISAVSCDGTATQKTFRS